MTYASWFEQTTSHPPFPFQVALATGAALPDLLEAPTGAGKTLAVLSAWLWRRRHAGPEVAGRTPRRLVVVLPMRTLVEQTCAAAAAFLAAAGAADVAVHRLLGGAVDQRWEEAPDADAVIVGTQDQLLSRALLRGYAMSRYKWPVHFALLHSDALWVLDEVQLMGVGLSTATQLDAFRARWATYGPSHTLWMSATLDRRLLATVDQGERRWATLGIGAADRADPRLAVRLQATKTLHPLPVDAKAKPAALAAAVRERHVEGTRTLVVLNRVAEAQALARALGPETALIHSRFRPLDRAAVQAAALQPDWTGILVATQAIEAGVDLSCRTLITDLAPWSSLVQRFGRCNRRGEHEVADVYWRDLPDDPKAARPYTVEALAHARAVLQAHAEVGVAALQTAPEPGVIPAGPVLRARDLTALFHTVADLSGRDIDVGRFVRDSGDATATVAWRDLTDLSTESPALHRDELCAVPVGALREFVEKKAKRQARVWDPVARAWAVAERVVPGRSYLLPADAGGYRADLGWTGDPKHRPDPVVAPAIAQDDDAAEALVWGADRWVSLTEHALDAKAECEALLAGLGDLDLPAELVDAAHWHDAGKVHPVWQAMIRGGLEPGDGPWAKSARGRGGGRSARPHFRHELVSALAWLEAGGSDLGAYLIAAHHGKVRTLLRARPTESAPGDTRVAHGVWHGDAVPAADLGDGVVAPAFTVTLDRMAMGDGSWQAASLALLDAWGPFRLAFLETLVRVADWRASRRHDVRPELTDA